MGDSKDSYISGAIKQVLINAVTGENLFSVDGNNSNKSLSKMELSQIVNNLKKNDEYSQKKPYDNSDEKTTRKEREKDSLLLIEEIENSNQDQYEVETLKERAYSQLTNAQLTEAIVYSQILGKPKCKTRRTGGDRHGSKSFNLR